MEQYIEIDAWKIIERGFHPNKNQITESLMSLGNGRMGGRGSFEESYSGKSLQGNYMAGIYYPDKTKVGWWKNGYPRYFAKVLNATHWYGLNLIINGEEIDLAKIKIHDFVRILDMKQGILYRECTLVLRNGSGVKIESERFLSMHQSEIGCVKYQITALDSDLEIHLTHNLDASIKNSDSNYGEPFWEEIQKQSNTSRGMIISETQRTKFRLASGVDIKTLRNNREEIVVWQNIEQPKQVKLFSKFILKKGDVITFEKYGVNITSEYTPKVHLINQANHFLDQAKKQGYQQLRDNHINVWNDKWKESDITIEGDLASQQGIRFNIFHLNQTYTGDDPRLNIGPKGFTGEKYGGSTYWDTEAFCLPFYLSSSASSIAKNLLLYRHKHLQKAIENASNLGFDKGAALFPMVTMNGEECHNEWEITFEEIHRNGAIARAIYEYINYTGDETYLMPYGFEVLLGIARFWSQRFSWSQDKCKYVILGVTGPNEYENNINNNYYTNRLAVWCLEYTIEVVNKIKNEYRDEYSNLKEKWCFNEENEIKYWKKIAENVYYPYDSNRDIFLQQDGFLDKEIIDKVNIPIAELPINQNWSWDRILRSCYIKQSDTLHSVYLFENEFFTEDIKRHFDFYEKITVHESSLSPSIHTILAAKIGYNHKAYEMYLRTARLDLDNFNNDTQDGLHITSMGGTWLAFAYGLAGMRVNDDILCFSPILPKSWESYKFRICYRKTVVEITVSKKTISILSLDSMTSIKIKLFDKEFLLSDKIICEELQEKIA